MRRVVVTGLGAVTPVGNDARSTWEAAVAGRSGVDFIRSFDASEFPVRIAAEVKDAALLDAGYDSMRVGILFGTAIGGFLGMMEQLEVLQQRGPSRVVPHFIPSVLPDAASGQLAISLGFRGVNYAPVSACATGSTAVGEGAEIIRRGDADSILAGGAEACMHPLILAGFCAMRGLVAE